MSRTILSDLRLIARALLTISLPCCYLVAGSLILRDLSTFIGRAIGGTL
jgi:hypothetical protein